MTTGPNSVVLTRKFLPQWALIVAIVGAFLCLIGLLALLVKEEETLAITAQPTQGGTRLDINGAASMGMQMRINEVVSKLSAGAPIGAVPAARTPSAPASPAAWHPDPSGRHEQRYWDGNAWTDHVLDNGQPSTDAPPQ